MTDELDEALAGLEKDQLASHRVYRRATITSLGAFLLLASINIVFVVLGGADKWFLRDLTAIGGLTALGMSGFLGAATAYRVVVQRDAELLDTMRKQVAMAKVVDEMRPLMAAIEEARAKGVPLLIPPGSVAPAPDKPSIH